MASKRKNADVPALTGREKKKQKTTLARTIAVQPATANTSGPSTPSQSAGAGPSRAVHFDPSVNLPGSLDVERFAEARAFEINAMHTAMKTARSNGTQRAWQQLPRHLRRRAASHDVRRVPVRLRDKATAEMDAPKPKKKSAPKQGKEKCKSRTAVFQKRQENKVWLETHLWHAKRMHMQDHWGYRLAESPTEKSYRPSHRASMHGSILHDASYMGLIELQGPEQVLKALLDSCCDPQIASPGAKRFTTGARACDTHLYKREAYPFSLVAPITVLWKPQLRQSTQQTASQSRRKTSKGKGKERESDENALERVVWIWAHPSVFAQVYLELQTAASFALEAVKKGDIVVDGKAEVQIADLREELNVFELMGPKSSQVIQGALKPVIEDGREEFKKCWSELANLQTTASVPRNTVIGFNVYDPRLSFPPKNAKVSVDEGALPSMSQAGSAFFPTPTLAQSDIWAEDVRIPLRKPKFKKKDIDERRSKNLVPGTHLQAQVQDARIPVLLIQRSVEASSASPGTGTHTPAVHGWTLVIPQGWSMAFFSSLIFTGTRVGGQRERQTQAFESGVGHFPRDYPSTSSYDEHSDFRAYEEEDSWERKPPAKRPNYARLGTRSPWKPDWDVVLGVRGAHTDDSTLPGDFVPAQRDMDIDGSDAEPAPPHQQSAATSDRTEDGLSPSLAPWLLRGPETRAVLDAAVGRLDPSFGLFEQIARLREKRKLKPLAHRPEDLYRNALVRVRLRMCGRGCPDDLAMIYGMEDPEAAKWVKATQANCKDAPAVADAEIDLDEESETSIVIPSPESIIGYVTTGNYSLSLGEGFAIGAIPVARFLELQAQAKRLSVGSQPLVKVRDRHEAICRTARIEILE
ncbi:POP1 and POPLD domain-containing protein [Phanerochaete sordida]|uniref:POP1 and POPLD domain-containing protein n=1 Tax=Phanerochaete sordida TaxID=48140 RepID=A0A9P3LBN6_9APHY|nr:POP1 and POPLD domain-containing protein [Phanerochaete sordida]